MTLSVLCVVLCIVGPLLKVSALPSTDLERKVENFESTLEAMSTIVLRLMKENEKLETMTGNVARLMKENEKLETMADNVAKLMKENEKLETMADNVARLMKENEKLETMTDNVTRLMKENEKLETMTGNVARLMKENEKLETMTDNVARLMKENEKLETMTDNVARLMKENEKLETMADNVARLMKENEKLETMADNVARLMKGNEKLETMADNVARLMKENEKLHVETMTDNVARLIEENEHLKIRVNLLEQMVRGPNDEGPIVTGGMVNMDRTRKQESGIIRTTDMSGVQDEEGGTKESYHRIQQNRKRIVPSMSSPTDLVAFHAYLSKENLGPLPAHHILKFDSVSINKGHGYNAYDGIFVAPTSGTYVFTWSIMSDGHGNVFSQLMKNSDIVGSRFADSSTSSEWDFSTGIVVVDVNQGDHVYVRLGEASVGNVLSFIYSRTTFSGWLLN
ncbi:uncharacterized protein LOC125662753 [Ostrea edulis]|uniref:uncharacterized protein LOC125662753 n=1 Tax=Ostrea edulis TaxID=37623 RepID=UPI0024AF35B0|nr:uncharacterized protein LOC125662753 [Ostrea edulis]